MGAVGKVRRFSLFGVPATAQGPSVVTIVLGVLDAIAQALVQLVLTGPGQRQWRDIAAMVLVAFGTLGIQPLFGPALTTLLHIPKQYLLALGALVTVGTGVITVVALPTAVATIVATVLTLVGALVLGAPPVVPKGPGVTERSGVAHPGVPRASHPHRA